MRTNADQLLDELVDRWARGEPLEVEGLLERAGDQSRELATLIDAFLERAPRRAPRPEALAAVRALDEPQPLLRARQSRRLKLDDLVSGLVARLGLPEGARPKVRRYYQDLELGQLDPAGVAASVWAALAGLLGEDANGLAAAPRLRAPSATATYHRIADFEKILQDGVTLLRLTADMEEGDLDEVDRLFGVTH